MNIDFVILWVDGNDPVWKQDFEKWCSSYSGDKDTKRYRDWDNLQYMFRAFESFTPWVRKIHFITYGHIPKWLNPNHPKINIVKHKDFLDKKNLPVFNGRPIENSVHKIKNLSEHFVFFNDDMFILKKMSPDRFFKNKLPRDMLAFTSVLMTHLAHIRLNDLLIINKHFNKKEFLIKFFLKWFNIKYGIHLLKSLFLLPWPQITGIVDPHQPQPFLKSTFIELWQKEPKVLNETSKSKFRKDTDVNQYLFRYWQLLTGKFSPVSFCDSLCIQIKNMDDAEAVVRQIIRSKYSLLCINDLLDDYDLFERIKLIVNNAFEKVLPDKSDFEL